ncbi:MAG: hypothetical protein J0I06_17885 [Planctomycetes bacterium]|nr:hypothetical protein [Planctomycetota bacterium]
MADLNIPNLGAVDARVAEFVFEFVQFLLDDDANLTPAGNLTGAARQRLRTRLDELIAAEEAGTASAGGADELVIAPDDILAPTAEKKEQP